MKLIVVEPGAAPQVRTVTQPLRELLGGIPSVMQFPFDRAAVIYDNSAEIRGKLPNRRYRNQWLHGTVLIVGMKDGFPCDLSPEQEVLYAQRWNKTEVPYEKLRWPSEATLKRRLF